MAKAEYHYGLHAIETLLQNEPERILSLFLMQGRDDDRLQKLVKQAEKLGVSVQKSNRNGLDKLTHNAQHQGVVAAVKPVQMPNEDDLNQLINNTPDVLLLVLDQVTDPHNLGACIRTAAAMGFDAVVIPKDRAAGITPVVRKVAAGGVDKILVAQVTNLARTLDEIKDQGVFVVGTVLNEHAKPLQTLDLKGNLAIVMGAEDVGLRRLTQDKCDQLAYIPMSGKLQSLNVSVAAGMCIYEVMRQRSCQSQH